jgi:hypothetical protein
MKQTVAFILSQLKGQKRFKGCFFPTTRRQQKNEADKLKKEKKEKKKAAKNEANNKKAGSLKDAANLQVMMATNYDVIITAS